MSPAAKKPTKDELIGRALAALHRAVGLGTHSDAVNEAVEALGGNGAPDGNGEPSEGNGE